MIWRCRSQFGNLLLAALTLLGMTGCLGYQFGAQSLYQPDIHTVYVPMIQSDSFRPQLGEQLTEAVVKQIELKTPYKVVRALGADSILTCHIVSENKRVLAENRNDEPRDIEVDFNVQVNWVDRRGDLISQRAGLALPPTLMGIAQAGHLVPEAGQSIATAHQAAINQLAEQVVAQMEVPW